MKDKIRIGTRGSPLALYQAELAKTRLLKDFPLVTIEIVKIKTGGDMVRRGVGDPLETKRIYTKEIEDALLRREIDLGVHSAKDMAAILPEGLKIGAVFEREDSRDCLISKDFKKIGELPLASRIGTSSLRRKMQLLRINPELIIEDVRGNVGTRIQKMEEGHYDGLVLAHAGIKRLGLNSHVAEVFDPGRFYPSPGQGIIAAECRADDREILEMLAPIEHKETRQQLECERAYLRKLQGGCQLPCGIHAVIKDGFVTAAAILLNTEAREWAESAHTGPAAEASRIGEELAVEILDSGGSEIMEKIKRAQAAKK